MEQDIYDLSYCAGYLDGDGCFYLGKTIQKPKNIVVYEYSIQILSVKREVLDQFCSKFGGFVKEKEKRPHHKTPYQWMLKGKRSAELTVLITDILVDKKIASTLFIEFSETISKNYWKEVQLEVIQRREEIIKKLREDRHMNNFVTKESVEAVNSRKKIIDPVPRDYAYLAGLIDSEGCFRIKHWKPKNKPNQVYTITLEIGNTKLPIMPFLVERFGGSITFIPARSNKKASATWTLSAKALYKILPKVYPFLTNKKDVCQKLLEFQNTILPNGGDRNSELFRALFERNREVRDRIIDEIHLLNAKGSHN